MDRTEEAKALREFVKERGLGKNWLKKTVKKLRKGKPYEDLTADQQRFLHILCEYGGAAFSASTVVVGFGLEIPKYGALYSYAVRDSYTLPALETTASPANGPRKITVPVSKELAEQITAGMEDGIDLNFEIESNRVADDITSFVFPALSPEEKEKLFKVLKAGGGCRVQQLNSCKPQTAQQVKDTERLEAENLQLKADIKQLCLNKTVENLRYFSLERSWKEVSKLASEAVVQAEERQIRIEELEAELEKRDAEDRPDTD